MSLRTASARKSKRGGGGVWVVWRGGKRSVCVWKHPVQPSVARRCQPVAKDQRGFFKATYATFFDVLCWSLWQRPNLTRHCLRSSFRTFRPGVGEGEGEDGLRVWKGDAVVLLPCPGRVRTDVHGGRLPHRHCRVAVVGLECVVTEWLLVNASVPLLDVDGVVDTRSK